MAEWASIGSYHHLAGLDGVLSWLPSIWRLVKNVPVLDQATPQNFSAIAVLAVAVSAALLLDQIWRSRTGEPLRLASARVSRTVLATGSAVVITAAMVVPWLLDWPMPTRPSRSLRRC